MLFYHRYGLIEELPTGAAAIPPGRQYHRSSTAVYNAGWYIDRWAPVWIQPIPVSYPVGAIFLKQSWNPEAYIDTQPNNAAATLVTLAPVPKIQSQLGVPFNPISYQDLTAPRAHAFLPSIIQCQVNSLLGIPYNPVAYQDLTAPRAHAFLPNTIQCKVQSQLGVPYNPVAYQDLTAPRAHAFLPNIIQTPPATFLNWESAVAPFNAGLTRPTDLGRNYNLYAAQVVQAPFFNQWWASYSPQAFGLGYTSWASLAQNSPPIPGTPVSAGTNYSAVAAPFNPMAFPPGEVWFNTQTQGPLPPPPFFNNVFWTAVAAPYSTLDYRDRTGPSDWNAFLPNQIQAPISSYGATDLTKAPYNTGDYRDRTYGASENAFLPETIQTPQATFLNYIENVAPFDTRSYRDLHIIFNPVALKPVPLYRPTPVAPFDPQRFSQTPLVNNLIYGLSAPVPPLATRLNFVENITPFNAVAFRDLSLQFNINLNKPFSLVPNPMYIGTYPGPFYVIGGPNTTRVLTGPPTTRKLQ